MDAGRMAKICHAENVTSVKRKVMERDDSLKMCGIGSSGKVSKIVP